MAPERTIELEDFVEELVVKVLTQDHSIIAYPEWIRRAIAQGAHRAVAAGVPCECDCHGWLDLYA